MQPAAAWSSCSFCLTFVCYHVLPGILFPILFPRWWNVLKTMCVYIKSEKREFHWRGDDTVSQRYQQPEIPDCLVLHIECPVGSREYFSFNVLGRMNPKASCVRRAELRIIGLLGVILPSNNLIFLMCVHACLSVCLCAVWYTLEIM